MDFQRIEAFCKLAHAGQRRKGGEPYSMHPLAVRDILLRYGINNPDILAAAILHDVIEDTTFTAVDIENVSNAVVAAIVTEVTRVHPAEASWEEKARILNQKATTFSYEAVAVKLSDRHHNLATSKTDFDLFHRKRYAKATLALLGHLPHLESCAILSRMAADLQYCCNEIITSSK